ncbi:MAG: hypothetical protein ACLSHC_16025 [Bilophila wadsworthia]
MGFDPMTMAVASFVIGAASSVASGVSASQQAKAQAQYQEEQAAEYARVNELNNKAAAQEYVEQSAAERMAQMQEQDKASRDAQEVQKEALQKKGEMLASTNASGLALDFLMADYERQEATRKDMIRENYEMSSAKSDLNVNAYKDRAQNRVNGQQNYISPGSSYSTGMNVCSGTALGIGGRGHDYDRYWTAKNKLDGVK